MDHSHHGGMPGMDDPSSQPMCSMNMLFTWDTTNLCIVFPSWRVTGFWSLIVSLLAIVVLTAGYEAVREGSRRFEMRVAAREGQQGGRKCSNLLFVVICCGGAGGGRVAVTGSWCLELF
jgi:copper transporter 1